MMGDDQIAELLLGARLVEVGGLNEARQQQRRDGGDLYTVLIENGHVDEAKTITLVARQLNIPCVSLSEFDADEKTLELIPAQMAADHRVIPLGVQSSEGIYLAMSNPIDFNALEAVNQHTGLDVHAFLVGPLDLDRALERCYGHAIYQGGAAMLGSDPFAGPSVSQLLDLPVLSEDFGSSVEEHAGDPRLSESSPDARPNETFMAAPSPLILAPPPLLSTEDLAQLEAFEDEDEEILEVDLEGFADNQAEDLFEVRSSRIFMVPDQLSESGRRRLLESKGEQGRQQHLDSNRTMMGYFRVEDEPSAEPALEDEPEEGSGGGSASMSGDMSSDGEASHPGELVSVHVSVSSDAEVHLKERTQLTADAAGERSQIGLDSYLRAFPRELTERSVQVLNQAYQSHDMVEVMEAADVGDLVRATVRVLLRSGLLREADLLRELATLHQDNNESG